MFLIVKNYFLSLYGDTDAMKESGGGETLKDTGLGGFFMFYIR